MMKAMLTTKDLTVGYGIGQEAVAVSCGINLTLDRGELVCLLGPNGAGKSTLLRTLSGQQPPLGGTVHLEGEDVSHIPREALARKVSLVLTERISTSLLTVYDLVCMGRLPHTGWSGGLTSADHAIVAEALTFVGGDTLAGKRLSELSDGERQRCMLARALAQQPVLLILDEVTAFLDLPRRIEMMHKLQALAYGKGMTVVLSTHDLDLALAHADRVLLQPQGGMLLDAGPEDMVLSGAFADAFASEGLLFDELSGSFTRPRLERGTVYLDATGIEAFWARRACERVGFRCLLKAACGDELCLKYNFGIWALGSSGSMKRHASLRAVAQALKTYSADKGR